MNKKKQNSVYNPIQKKKGTRLVEKRNYIIKKENFGKEKKNQKLNLVIYKGNRGDGKIFTQLKGRRKKMKRSLLENPR